MDYIELLEEKGFKDESISKIQSFVLAHNKYFKDEEEVTKVIETIFRLFGYCGCSNSDIEMILNNNINILLKKTIELVKAAYVWSKAGVLDSMNKYGSIKIDKINRIYLRILYLESSFKRNASPISYNALIMGEEEFAGDYHGKVGTEIFSPSYDNLLSLYIRQGQTDEEKERILNEVINAQALRWISNMVRKEKENASQRKNRSI